MIRFMKYAAILAIPLMFSAQAARAQPAGSNDANSSLHAMLAYVYQHNPRLNAERGNLKIADEKLLQANAGFRPTLNADASSGRQRGKAVGEDWQYGNNSYVGLTVIQPLFSGFGTLEQQYAATSQIMAARAQLLSVKPGWRVRKLAIT